MWESTSSWVAVACGFVAAWLWWKASRIKVPHDPVFIGEDGEPAIDPFATADASGMWNVRAAVVTALAVLFQALALVAHRYCW